jgi:F5/8 type C domain
MSLIRLSLMLALSSLSALAAPMKITAASASSSAADSEGVNYQPANLMDHKQGSAWVEGDQGSGLGAWAQLDLEGSQSITGLKIWNGYWYTADFWARHNRVKEMELEFSDGTKHKVTLKDEMTAEVVSLPSPVTASWVKLKVKSVYNGNTFNDTVISEVEVLDKQPVGHASVASYKASSTYPADSSGNYEARNLDDGIIDSMWCEADKADGAAQWVEFTFAGSTQVSKLKLRNGNGTSMSVNMKNNKVKTATLVFGDGSKEAITLKGVPSEQIITFAPRSTNKVKLVIDTVQRGSDQSLNDTCISEAVFAN